MRIIVVESRRMFSTTRPRLCAVHAAHPRPMISASAKSVMPGVDRQAERVDEQRVDLRPDPDGVGDDDVVDEDDHRPEITSVERAMPRQVTEAVLRK